MRGESPVYEPARNRTCHRAYRRAGRKSRPSDFQDLEGGCAIADCEHVEEEEDL